MMNFSVAQTVFSTVNSSIKTTTESGLDATFAVETDYGKRYPNSSESLNFLFIPLAVLITIMLLSVMVYLMARKKHRIFNKHSHVPSFTFDSSDLEDDNDMETEYLLKGKLRLDEPLFKGINSSKTYTGGRNELYA